MKKVIVIGGGAAGFFTAINIKELNPNTEVVILEKSANVLQKVKVSGGGRCNVTHACFEPKELVKFYPRGEKELLGPFHKFMTGDTFEWFDNHNVPLKIEKDNRVFPESNSSQTIIDCFSNLVDKLQIKVLTNTGVTSINKQNKDWVVNTKEVQFYADVVVMATGSSKQMWKILENMEHTIVAPVPSLFTFTINDSRIRELLGLSVANATVSIAKTNLENYGPLLITHWGLSGPAVLKLSAFGALDLAEKGYQYNVVVNWLSRPTKQITHILQSEKKKQAKKNVVLKSPFTELPKRLWERLALHSGVTKEDNWADISNVTIDKLANELTNGIYNANGKSTFKEEFVTAGGVQLDEINFKRFESKKQENLFVVGECLNIDAVTGGFNFQNAWTSAYLAAKAIAE